MGSNKKWTKEQIESLYKMREEGVSYSKIAKKLGRTVEACKTYSQRFLSCSYRKRKTKKDASICWFCVNSVPNMWTGAGCSWSRRFEPVEGWTAIGETLKGYKEIDEAGNTTYRVIACPEFKEE